MLLSANMIASELRALFPALEVRLHAPEILLDRPLFCQAEQSSEPGRVNLCPAECKAEPKNDRLLVRFGASFGDVGEGNQLLLSDETDAYTLFNALQRIFDRYDRWDDALLSATGQQADLSELLNAATALMQNPLLICAADYSIIARSSTLENGAELSGSHVSYKLVNALALDTRFQGFRSRAKPYRYTERSSATECLCLNLFSDGALRCILLAAATERPLQTGDDVLLARLSEHVRSTLTGASAFGGFSLSEQRSRRVAQLLKNAVSDEKVDYIPIMNGLAEIGWLNEHTYCCIAIRIGSLDYRAHTVDLLCSQIEELLPHCCAFEHDGNVAVVVNLTRFNAGADDAVGSLVYFLRDNFLKTGVGNEFTGFIDMFYFYRQANIALNYVTRPQSYMWIMRFSNVAVDYMMEQCLRELPLHVACAGSVLSMKRYDEAHNTEFYRTLVCYLENRFNAMQTAKALFIHRSTFLYRMERIRELFHVDLENEDALLYTMISCKMLEMSRSLTPAADSGERDG